MAGTVTVNRATSALDQVGVARLELITVTWTADAAAATIPNTSLGIVRGTLERLVTNPGTPAPTDNYGITIIDGEGIDVLQGVGAARDTATTEQGVIIYTGTSLHPVVSEELTFRIAANAVNGAQGVAKLYVVC